MLPPYAIQSLVFFTLNEDELNNFDQDFKEKEEQKTISTISGIAPIFKTKSGARLYFIGSNQRFGRVYDIAFIKNGSTKSTCTPLIIYSDEVAINCNINLSDNWVLNYSGIIRHRINELVESKI